MNFSNNDIAEMVKKFYGINVSVKLLTGEYELNYLLTGGDGTKYIFKVASDEHSYDFFDAQVKIVQHLSQGKVANKFFSYISNVEGAAITVLQPDEKKILSATAYIFRGRILGECKRTQRCIAY